MSEATETCRAAFPFADHPRISYGLPFAEACAKHIEQEYQAYKVYVIVSKTLANTTNALRDLQAALGSRVIGTRIGMKPHTMMSECLEITLECQKLGADCIVTLGGGSLSDAAKLIAMALGNNVQTAEQMLALPYDRAQPGPNVKPPKFPIICIPTLLSGGEYSNYAGATKDDDHMKIQFSHPLEGPKLIILDPQLACHSPLDFWLQSGVRAFDHCVEVLSGLESDKETDKACIEGIQCLLPGLLKTKADPVNVGGRLAAQLGIPYSMTALRKEILPGASHGIGHNLGPFGVGHGHTSCILMPAVAKYNAAKGANNVRQAAIRNVFWDIPEAKTLFEAKGLSKEKNDLGDLIDCFIRALGQPRSLREVGIGKDKFWQIAVNSVPDLCTRNNPAPLKTPEAVMEILEMVA